VEAVTVVMVAYGAEDWLERAVDAALASLRATIFEIEKIPEN